MGLEASRKPPSVEGQLEATPPVAEQVGATPPIEVVEGATPEDTLRAIADRTAGEPTNYAEQIQGLGMGLGTGVDPEELSNIRAIPIDEARAIGAGAPSDLGATPEAPQA